MNVPRQARRGLGRRSGPLLAAGIVVAALVGVLLVGRPSTERPLDPRSHEPDGTSALVALLRELGAEVGLDAGPPDDATDVALLLRDRLDDGDTAALQRWTQGGGTLVVTDPASSFAPQNTAAGVLGDLDELTDPSDAAVPVDVGACDIAPLQRDGTTTIQVLGPVLPYDVPPAAQSCFGDGDAAYVVATPQGEGTVVALAGSGIVTNRALSEADNAPVLATLLGPTSDTRLAVLDPSSPTPTGEETLWGAVPTGVKRALAQLALAFVIYVAWRARRLGRPVHEPQPVAVASSELVAAVGGLLARTGSAQHAADVLRAELRRELASQLGLPPDLPSDAFIQLIAARSGLDVERLELALGPGRVGSDHTLVNVANDVDVVRKEVLDRVATGTPYGGSTATVGGSHDPAGVGAPVA
jgi:hypothetical protein